MRVIANLDDLRDLPRSTVITPGNFDGVHLGHQELLRGVVRAARPLAAAATAITFEPHPARILAPEHAPRLLTPLPQKIRLIEKTGVDLLVVLPFNQQLAHLSPEEFVRSILVEKLGALAVIVGPDFRFGHRRAGDVKVLDGLARQHGFKLEVFPVFEARGGRVSSSRIRELLSAGRVGMAGRLLGRPHAVEGAVVSGLGVGKKQTVPTLNLAPVDVQLPANGVYVTRTTLAGLAYDSASNVGHKPTFGEHRLTVESFLLNFHGEIRASEMKIEFLHRLRDEVKFPDSTALKTQIQKDARRSLKFFSLLKRLRRDSSPQLASSPAV